jgi:hypothetical protein
MAQLPPDGRWLIQQNDGIVVVFDRHTEEEVLKVDPSDANAMALAQRTIYDSDRLDAEQKCFAHFWCGYFYAHASV